MGGIANFTYLPGDLDARRITCDLNVAAMRDLERFIVLQTVDIRWREHLENMDYMREGIHLRGMAQKDPLVEYRNEGHGMFLDLTRAIREEVVTLLFHAEITPDDGTVFGRRTMPRDMALCSLACAVQNLWLAARVEDLGLGWVSMFDPEALANLLQLPAGAQPMAVLCLGPVPAFYAAPMLEQLDWRQGRPLAEFIHTNTWNAATSTAPTSP